jgi:hypothetical protein
MQEHRAWHVGALGEEAVGRELWRLSRGTWWRYVHSVPVGTRGSDIDHVLVGPAGVFTINTKHHRGANIWVAGNTFMVNGQKCYYVRNSRYEAERASRLLSRACGFPVPVRALIVVVDPRDISVREAPPNVGVCTRYTLRRWISSQPMRYGAYQIDVIFNQARRSTTWS